MNNISSVLCVAAALVALLGHAQLTSTGSINFQAALNGPNGQPLANGNYTFTFAFYDASAGGAAIAMSTVSNVPVAGGIASTVVSADPAIFNRQSRYLGISINGGPELSPRLLLTTVPYAISAEKLGETAFLGTNGNLGIGTRNPENLLHILGKPDSLPPLRLDQGGDGAEYGLMITSPNSGPSARLFLEDSRLTFAAGSGTDPAFHFQQRAGGANAGIMITSPDSGPSARIYLEANRLSFEAGDGTTPAFQFVQRGEGENAGMILHSPGSQSSARICLASNTLFIGKSGGTGITVQPNGTTVVPVLQITSDRNRKQHFQAVDAERILEKLASLPVTTWAYKDAPEIRHIGPVAQDFAAAFGVGEDDKHIATVDADGVALVAIQALNQKLEMELQLLQKRLRLLEQALKGAMLSAENAP